MSQIKYLHVFEYDDGERLLGAGKGSRSGTHVILPEDEDDEGGDWERREWERVDYWQLPEPMPKSEFEDWWNEHREQEPQPSPIPEVLEAVEEGDDG